MLFYACMYGMYTLYDIHVYNTYDHRSGENLDIVFFSIVVTLPPTKYRNPKTEEGVQSLWNSTRGASDAPFGR